MLRARVPPRVAGSKAAARGGGILREAMTTQLARRKVELGEPGPALAALPPRWQLFVTAYLIETYANEHKNNYGAQAAAARAAGFGHAQTTPLNMARIASRLMRDERVVRAITEESRKYIRA